MSGPLGSAREFSLFKNKNSNQLNINSNGNKSNPSSLGTGKPNISQKHDEIAHDGYYGRKQEGTETYKSASKNNRAYIKENRVPKDNETFLIDSSFTRTKVEIKGAKVYKYQERYYYRDTLHEGKAAHIEVFDSTGKKHLGEADPITGILDTTKADPNKKIDKYLR